MLASERAAQRVIDFIVEHSLLRAECAEDPEHPCIVIWHESAVEQLAALIDDLERDETPGEYRIEDESGRKQA